MKHKKNYTQEEALEECFAHLRSTEIGEKQYKLFHKYKMRYKEGKLGLKAIENILTFFGFIKVEKWIKARKEVE